MPTPDPQDAPSSPDYSGAEEDEMAVEQKPGVLDPNGKPPTKTTAPKTSAKDPTKPRRKKARRACYACQRAHLTCADERPCHRCVSRGLQDQCQDGIRKKAKYLHDAPDSALMPGVGGHYPPFSNGAHAMPVPGHDQGAVALAPPGNFYPQASPGTYYGQNPAHGLAQTTQDFAAQQAPISPPFTQNPQTAMQGVQTTAPPSAPGEMQQFGGALFDPSDPALFNFDISSLNFGNHYGALEMGMLGHIASGAAETPPSDNMMNPMDQAGMYAQQMQPGHEGHNMAAAIPFGADGLAHNDWPQQMHSRNGSLQMQTPNNTPTTATLDHSHRQDSMTGPHAYAIGQGPSSLSSTSPVPTEAHGSIDSDGSMMRANYLANRAHQQALQQSPGVSRGQQENNFSNTILQPVDHNAVRKRRHDTEWYYEIDKPYDYVAAFHRLVFLMEKRFPPHSLRKIRASMSKWRPLLMLTNEELGPKDRIHQEMMLLRSRDNLERKFASVGVPSIICRRSGELVWASSEFSMLTEWSRAVLLGQEANMNVNFGVSRSQPSESGVSSQAINTPIMSGQESNDSAAYPVNIVELMDERSAVEFFDDFSELAYLNSRGHQLRRVNMLRYRTKEDVAGLEEMNSRVSNMKPTKDGIIKLEGGPVHRVEEGMRRMGSKNGVVDCMCHWHVKRDHFDLPMLICINILPVLDKGMKPEGMQ